MYSLPGYSSMMADHVRMGAYREALRRAVRPGSTVVDLGAGPGIMSRLALQFGAAKVHAIEPSETIEIGRAIAQANGLHHHIEFHHAFSDAVTLPERADVVVADLRGVLPAFPGNFNAVADARARFLKPGGTLIPQCDRLSIALAEAPESYHRLTSGWESEELDLSIGRRMAANNWRKVYLHPHQLISAPAQWATVDYRTVKESFLAGGAQTRLARRGNAHALCVWFDAELLDGVGFSNAPGQPEAIYGQAFFPLLEPVPVDRGDHAEIELRADLTGDDYTWSWHTTIRSADGSTKADFHQSTFFGTPLSPEILRKRADGFVPNLNHEGLIDSSILKLMGSGLTLREIATRTAASYPARFPDWKAALDRVAALSSRYGE